VLLPVNERTLAVVILTIKFRVPAHHAHPKPGPFCASKAAVNMMGRSIHLEKKPQNGHHAPSRLSPGTVGDPDANAKINSQGRREPRRASWPWRITPRRLARASVAVDVQCPTPNTYCGEEISLARRKASAKRLVWYD